MKKIYIDVRTEFGHHRHHKKRWFKNKEKKAARRARKRLKKKMYGRLMHILPKLKRGTRIERMVKDALNTFQWDFVFQKGFLCKLEAVRVVDFYLPNDDIFLEIDGPEHDPVADAKREAQLKLSRPNAVFCRIKNHEVLENSKDLPSYIFRRIWEAKLNRKKQILTPYPGEVAGGVGLQDKDGQENQQGYTKVPHSLSTIKAGDSGAILASSTLPVQN